MFSSIDLGINNACGLREDGSPVCWGRDRERLQPPEGEAFEAIIMGWDAVCGHRSDGSVLCWGFNNLMQTISLGGESFQSVSVARDNDICGVRKDGSLNCWEWDSREVGKIMPPEGELFTSIDLGIIHACGLRNDGSPLCWLTDEEEYPRGPDYYRDLLTPPELQVFKSVSAGLDRSCGLREDAIAVCWGPKITLCTYDGIHQRMASTLRPVNRGRGYFACGVRLDGGTWGDPFRPRI